MGHGNYYKNRGIPRPKAGGDAGSTKDFNELRTYMNSNYGVTVTKSVEKVEFDVVRSAASEIEFMLKEFPQAATSIRQLNGDENRPDAYASASFYGSLQLSPKNMGKQEEVAKSYARDVRVHWHPEGTTHEHISTHEAGHLLERALIEKQVHGWIDKVQAWNKHKLATKVVSEAAKAVKKTEAGKGSRIEDLVGKVSRYAQKNRSETLAEAVADFRANGEKAQPLSREIWKILKRELG